MKKLRRNKLGGLMIPVSSIGAAHKTKQKPKDDMSIGLRLGRGQLHMWPNFCRYSDNPIEHIVPFAQWYATRYQE